VIFDLHMFFSQRGVAHQLCQGSHALAWTALHICFL
jgi:hypothetical protein